MSVKVSLKVIDYYIDDIKDYWYYWINKVIGRYTTGKAKISEIVKLLGRYEDCKHISKLKNKMIADQRFWYKTEYQNEASFFIYSDQHLLQKIYGNNVDKDYLRLPDDCLQSQKEFKRFIIYGFLMTHDRVCQEYLADRLKISYSHVMELTKELEKKKKFKPIFNYELKTKKGIKDISLVNYKTFDIAKKDILEKVKYGCIDFGMPVLNEYGNIELSRPVGVHVDRADWFKYYKGSGFNKKQMEVL